MKDGKPYNIWNKSYGKTIFKSITSVPIDYFHFGGKEFIRRERLRQTDRQTERQTERERASERERDLYKLSFLEEAYVTETLITGRLLKSLS